MPNLYRQAAAEIREEEGGPNASASDSSHIVRLQNRPLIGVLYSISAGEEGELFPIYAGRNSIGSDPSCDICLRETSVSSQHAMLLGRKQTDEGGKEFINVILSDNNSSYGTTVNGERLDFERVTCNDGDVIAFGESYVLILSLFNALNKLSVSKAFDRIPEPKKATERQQPERTVPFSEKTKRVPGASLTGDKHNTKTTPAEEDESVGNFYQPSKPQSQDHYNNKTIIL